MKDPVHVVCACNSSYILPLAVMLTSLVENFDRQRDLVIHVINNDATLGEKEGVRESLQNVRPGLEHVDLQWHTIDPTLVENLTLHESRISRDTFSRFYAPYLLPETCERVVYLDCDMVILADLSVLYDSTANSDAVVHAVHDLGYPHVSSELGVFDYEERGIPADAPYFNSGVMVMNFPRWRERDLTRKMVDYLAENGTRVKLSDQGALNAFLYQDWAPLDTRWNSPAFVLIRETWDASGEPLENRIENRNHPYIIHYTSHKKPWLKGMISPRYSYFFKYLQKTVYKDSIPHRPRLEDYLGFRLYYHLWTALRKLPRPGRRSASTEVQPVPAQA